MLALVDWGIGGLELYSRLRRRAPHLSTLYISDAGSAPYGTLSKNALLAKLAWLDRLCRQAGATHLVVACNTLSSVLPEAQLITPAAGVIAPTLEALRRHRGRVGIVGTRQTIRSGAYLNAAGHGRTIVQESIQPLGTLVEGGGRRPDAHRLIRSALAKMPSLDTLVLACTHYSAVRDIFASEVDAKILNPVDHAEAWIASNWLRVVRPSRVPSHSIVTTGSPAQMRIAAERAFGLRLGPIKPLHERRYGDAYPAMIQHGVR